MPDPIGAEFDGVFFTEGTLKGFEILGPLEATVSKQNASLREVKSRMAAAARAQGATTVMSFSYGQRSHRWFERLYKWDTELWFGEGVGARPMSDH